MNLRSRLKGLYSKANNTFIKNSFWLIGEKVISLAFVLVINILIARQLGAESFGVLSYLLAILGLITPLSSIGFNAIITRELVNKADSANSTVTIMSTALVFRLVGGVLAFLLCWLVVQSITLDGLGGNQWALMLFAAVNIANSLHVIDFWFQSTLKNRVIVICRFINTVSFFFIKLVCFFQEAILEVYIWVHAAEFLSLCLLFLIAFMRHRQFFSFNEIDWAYGLRLMRQAGWLILSGIASVIYLKIDQVMLGEIVSSQEVGIYAVASRLSEVWYFFATAIVTAYFPKILNVKEVDQNQYQHQLQRICDALFILALIIAIAVTLLGPWVIALLYGEEYIQAGAILVIHIWASLFVFMRALLSKWFIAEHLVKFSLFTHGLGSLVNVSLNYYLIPAYGGVGAAIATVISYAMASYFALLFTKSTWPMARIMSYSLIFPFRLALHSLKLARN